jgi:solute:Na+ symporter, SSS family
MHLHIIDITIIALYFILLLVIGIWAYYKNKDTADFFIAGGNLPWWLSGISHHVSGYSGAVFVAYAGLAYTHGFSLYVWWAFTIGITVVLSARVFPRIWVRLRKKLFIQSPLEFLSIRYNIVTQQIIAWSGVVLKVFDVGAKWTAVAVLLHVFTGIPVTAGILIAGMVSLLYITFGGLWAVIFTDFAQFLVQLAAGSVMFIIVLINLGGISNLWTFWDLLPEGNARLFNEPYTAGFALAFLFINFLSYNGGTWNLATRYISAKNETEASNAALLSGVLYLIWPLILFLPLWAAPIFLPALDDPTQSYALITLQLLPVGFIGLVVASIFANTMSMTSSDINTVSAVITRDIVPVVLGKSKIRNTSLMLARTITVLFTISTIIVAFQYEYFGGVLGLIVIWFGASAGIVAIPILFGLLRFFRRSGSVAAVLSMVCGMIAFIVTKSIEVPLAVEVGLPTGVAAFVYIGVGLVRPKRAIAQRIESLFNNLNETDIRKQV